VEFGRRRDLPAVLLEVPAGAGGGAVSISLQGKIDRIDLGKDGAFRIIDYKGGRPPRDPDARGAAFQLPLYLLAGAAVLEARGRPSRIEESEAAYLFLKGDQKPRSGPRWAEALARLQLGARTVAAGIESGLFFQNPGRDRENCKLCAFRNVCDPRVETIASRKSDERITRFREMKETLRNAEGKRR
jgi:RecB family exonuclease